MSTQSQTAGPAALVRIEAAALSRLADRLDSSMAGAFERALTLLLSASAAGHRIIVTGIGKSGLIARKLAATLASTGTAAHFLHAADALHGDLGILQPGDIVLALSYSGETEELLRLLPTLTRIDIPIVALCGCSTSTLAKASTITLDASVDEEACTLNLAPTASTTVMLALGDALAISISQRRGFASRHFAALHPGGLLGRRLERVRDVMHTGDAIPRVARHTAMPEVIHEMSRKHLGMTAVLDSHPDGDQLAGIISDGDLRRLLERAGNHALEKTAGDIMNSTPVTISPEALGSTALALMEERRITSLIVIEDGRVTGALHLHDLWQGAKN